MNSFVDTQMVMEGLNRFVSNCPCNGETTVILSELTPPLDLHPIGICTGIFLVLAPPPLLKRKVVQT